MPVSFVKKYHTCNKCGEKSTTLCAVQKNRELLLYYAPGSRPDEPKEGGIYLEHLKRDEYGIVISRKVEEKACEACGEFALVEDRRDSDENVLNFYPRTDAHKWLDGLGKAGL